MWILFLATGPAVSFQRVTLCLRISLGCLGNFMGPSRPTTQGRQPGPPLESPTWLWKTTSSDSVSSITWSSHWGHPYKFQVSTVLGFHTTPKCPPISVVFLPTLSLYPHHWFLLFSSSPSPHFQSTSRIFSISNSQGDPCFPQSPHLCHTSLGLWTVAWLSYT